MKTLSLTFPARNTDNDSDFILHGNPGDTVFLLTPLTTEALEHLEEHTDSDSSWLGQSLTVEHRYVRDVVIRLHHEGFTVSG